MSTTTQESDKTELLSKAAEVARHGKGSGGPPRDDVEGLIRAYYRHVAPEDLLDRSDADVYGGLASHYKLASNRPQGTAQVRVVTPAPGEHGWSAGGHTVVEVVVDDMPFLVDSLTMELSRQLRDVHLVVHPQFDVERTITGDLVSVAPVADGASEPEDGRIRESWMHVEIDRIREGDDPAAVVDDVQRVLRDVRESVEDWSKMNDRITEIVTELDEDPPPLDADELRQASELLTWLADGHFTFLGYREYTLDRVEIDGEDEDVLRAVPGTGLGILRSDQVLSESFGRLPDPVKAKAREKTLLVLAKANSRATVHRPAYLDYVGVKTFDADGEVNGERRFLGLFSSAAYTESLLRIPLVREKVQAVLQGSGFDPQSHAGKALLDTLETYPRDDLFHTPVEELGPLAEAAMQARERRAVRMFIRKDTYGRYVSVLVYLPRDRYNTGVREKFVQILKDRLGADDVEFNVRINESTTARVHFVVHRKPGESLPDIDTGDLERRLSEASRSWRDDFIAAVIAEYGEEVGSILGRRYLDSFPEAYKEDFAPRTASVDLGRLEAIPGDEGLDHSLYQDVDAGTGEARLKLYRIGSPLSLSEILPMLSSMGVEVVDERPYTLVGLERPSHIYEFGLRYPGKLPEDSRAPFEEAIWAVEQGLTEIDGFNALVLGAQISWRDAVVLRAYAKYMKQCGSPFALDYIEDALLSNVAITQMLIDLFGARFDPDRSRDEEDDVARRIEAALDDVASLDHDRILRSYLDHIQGTLRTNYYQYTTAPTGDAPPGQPHSYISLKLDPSAIPDMPEPRPAYEIFVYSPKVEGVHLRFGLVARGGLRWSDRRDDFRTEVLGLVKAQMVKNTVIVPVGAKGGFFAKALPDPAVDRDAWLAEGIACYKTFISGLLDVTDNLVDGKTVPPDRVVRHDGDDSYLVVAADKGTASFSDIANGVAEAYDFWLGDAFASGGSVGYDHKSMGITARGAWVSVQRHFREMGVDCQTEEFTCVGIGDMSGDVFGNGMLCSKTTRLVAAFDHRDIFIDPDPDAATSYDERKRLFELPRSSWEDYDSSLISKGGGVFSRSAKSVKLNPEIRAALGIAGNVEKLTPNELIRAILLAPADLLWNGGIGTYVKAEDETNAEVGDKANDAIRVDGGELRVRCVGEGGNLGLTQRGRIEYAIAGGRVNTDFIDNSAGVDTSDHEVNLKILLDRVVKAGDMTHKQRNTLLAEMTDEVASLVLADNYDQNIALANAAYNAAPLLHVQESWIKKLERDGVISREREALPTPRQVQQRIERGVGLTVPELAVVLAWTKIVLANELIETDLPDDPYLNTDLTTYFPEAIQERFPERIAEHPLRREIIVTRVVNDLINGAGMTYWPRLAGETGASAAELTRANFVAREIFGSLPLRKELETYDNTLPASVLTQMRIEMRTLVERGSRWLVTNRRPPLDSQGLVDQFTGPMQATIAELPDLMLGRELDGFEKRKAALVKKDVPEDLATKVATLPTAYQLLNVIEIAGREKMEPAEVARIYFAIGERLGLPVLVEQILSLPRDDQWQTMARATLRDDLYAVHAQLTSQVISETSSDQSAAERLEAWVKDDDVRINRAATTLAQICSDGDVDLARMSVGLRVVRRLLG
ncbi:NAD-glutamate dehydrogenase [Nocardioides sp. GXZ039]|uniref:NAD-glutamate dehydrogenase n=1 Tax=Nocardioides sp. GXZ039 TaxID=3136018 RepID=UPI0030F39677